MVNDTTTLNGALAELGETMAANITTKGVSASASDGLTTLAGKILQITGGGGGGGTVLVDDNCSSASGLSNYGNNVIFERSSSTTLTFNTDEYVLSGSTCCFGGREVLGMHGVDDGRLRIKFKLNTTNSAAYNQFCIFCTDKVVNDNPPFEYGTRVRNDKLFQYFTIQNESTIYTHSVAYSTDWFYLEAEKDGTSWTINLYDSGMNKLATDTRTLSAMTSPNWYFAILTEKGTDYSVHIKEVYGETLGGGSDCSQYQTEISNAIEYINGSGS